LNLLHCAGCCLCVFYLGYDQALLAALQAIPAWNKYFDTPTGTTLGLIASSLYFPGLFASFFGSWVSMKYGRKPTVWIGSALIIIGTFVNAFATNTGIFCGGRVLVSCLPRAKHRTALTSDRSWWCHHQGRCTSAAE
jgi:MFS family permease